MTRFSQYSMAWLALFTPSLCQAQGPIVAGFERFHAAPETDPVKGGLLLLGELNCTSCHKAEGMVAAQLLRKQAPILDGVGGRVKLAYLRSYLADPSVAKPGTTMPHALGGLEEKERDEAVEALAHFLSTTGVVSEGKPDPRSIPHGKELYRQIGCVACHGVREDAAILPTSVPLPDLAAKYSLPGLTAFLANPHKIRPSGRMPSLNLDGKDASAVANYLLKAEASDKSAPAEAKPNVRYEVFEGEWKSLPDFATLPTRSKGESFGFDTKVSRRRNMFAIRFEGFLWVDGEDDFTFFTTSDDGSKLWVDDKPVADSDGIHPAQTGSGKIHLTTGAHKVVVGFFDGGGQVELEVEFENTNLSRQPLDSFLSLTDQLPKPREKAIKFTANPDLVEKGRSLFSTIGCASCHQLNRDGKILESKLFGPDLVAMKPDAGCLAANPPKAAMRYPLTSRQKTSITSALSYLAKAPAKPDAKETIARTMTAFNCYACHARDGVGGVEEARNASFEATYADLGDEGRLPPALTGVGAKLKETWLNHIFAEGAKDRPYMKARMPKFGEANIGFLTSAYAQADPLPEVAPVVIDQPEKRIKAAGRQLVGTQAFGCVQCHNFKGEKSTGIPALDMTIMTRRVRHDWFVNYVVNPAAYRPGTRMPSAWPTPESQLTEILDGSSKKQIEAVWTFLADGADANTPYGIGRSPIPLVATKEAIVYRNFIQGAGPRAIGVGYPEKANIAYDANNGRIALIWQGAFMDASRHWTGRGEGFQPPMGDNVLKLPEGPSMAILKNPDDAWPTSARKSLEGFQFKGYRLDKSRKPLFLFAIGPIKVEDVPEAVAAKDAPELRRTLNVTSDSNAENLWYRAAVGSKIEKLPNGWYSIDKDLKIKIDSATDPVIRPRGETVELVVPIKLQNGSAKITQTYQW